MTYDPDTHHRRSIRLEGYDYGQAGAYFVTVCVHTRACLFGEIVDETMRLNSAGAMAQAAWDELPGHYPGVETDAFVVMPNHVHAIIVLTHPVGAAPRGRPELVVGAGPRACPNQTNWRTDHMGQPRGVAPTNTGQSDVGQPRGGAPTNTGQSDVGQPRGVAPTDGRALSLGDVVHRFKTWTTTRYIHGVKQCGWRPFPGRLWQRNYYEHIIRNDVALNRIRQYILDNPARWAYDHENPQATNPDPEDAWRE